MWSIQDSTVKTSGEFWGRFSPEFLEEAYRWCFLLAQAKQKGLVIIQCGDTEFRICNSALSLFGNPEEALRPPERMAGGWVRANDACVQFREHAWAHGLPDQKANSFRRMLADFKVRKQNIGGTVWHEVDHMNEVLRRIYKDKAPVIRASYDAPQMEQHT